MQVHSKRLSTSILAVLCLAGLAALPTLASAAPQEDGAKTLERIEVTGSRIRKAEIEGAAPMQVITRAELDASGLTSVVDVLQRLTAGGSALNTKFNSSGNFGFPPDGGGVGAGAATVDLRHLGSKRVLVLVDGIRWVNESSASGVGGVVDLNTIPLAIVERIEVLEDGASSIYGSDAIAGVVNIITKRGGDGVRLNTTYGRNEEGDGETTDAELSFAGAGDNHSFVLAASYHRTKPIFSRDRAISRFPVPGTGVALGSSAIPAGRFIFTDPNTGRTQDLVPTRINPRYDPTQTCPNRTDDFRCFTSADRFNFSVFNLLLTPSERKAVFGQAQWAFSDSLSWWVKGLYNNRESLNQAAAEPLFLGIAVPTNFWADNVRIPANHPFNPFGFELRAGPGGNFPLGGRRPLEGGPRRFFQDVDTFYFGTGLEGNFTLADREWFWDLNIVRTESEAEQTNFGSYNARRIWIALGDPAVCAANPGCTPLNIFGAGSITPAMLAYIQPVLTDRSDNRLTLYSANLSGDLMELPAGPLSFATGWEYRELKGSYRPDGLTIAGEYNGVPSQPTSGSYDVSEFYAEFNVPLVADIVGFEALDLSLAARYSDYSTFGGETTGKAGLRWQVNDQLLVRGTFAEGFRAPSIGELFGTASGFDAVINDPCSANAPGGRNPNCNQLGVPPGYVQPNPQISVLTGGNRALKPERADSITAGLVFSPSFAAQRAWSERLDLEITYYRHEIQGGIQAVDAQTQLNLCVQTLSPTFCQGIRRNSLGAIDRFANFLTNIGQIDTRGYDVNVGWQLPATDWGEFNMNWRNTWVDDYVAIGAAGARQPQGVGIEVANSAIPEWTSNLLLGWRYGDWAAHWTVRHISDLNESCGNAASFPVCRNNPSPRRNRLGSTTYHDVQVSWDVGLTRETTLAVGVNNVGDKDAPYCLSCTLNGYDASTYDVPGRFIYVRADFKF